MAALRFDEEGLIPVVTQDRFTGQVLMLAYMDAEALRRTAATGEAWYWSRSRRALWRKGETSGHTQTVHALRVDCDGDAVLLVVEPRGPACHTGRPSCFFQDLDAAEAAAPTRDDEAPGAVLEELFDVVRARRAAMPESSYTAALLRGGVEAIGAKVAEEAAELVRAAREEPDRRLVEETADVLYHMWVLLVGRGVALADVAAELRRRRDGTPPVGRAR